MKHIDFLEIITQVLPFVGAEHTHGKTDEGPHMYHGVPSTVMLTEFVDLGMAIMTAGDAVVRSRRLDLLVFQSPELEALLFETGLQKTAATPAAVVVGPVGLHVDEVFLADDRFDHKPEVLGDGIAIAFADNLTGVLNRELDFEVLVPIGIDFQFAFTDPLGIVFINVLNFKIVLEIEFFQSCQD
jgi:hypothetical protein